MNTAATTTRNAIAQSTISSVYFHYAEISAKGFAGVQTSKPSKPACQFDIGARIARLEVKSDSLPIGGTVERFRPDAIYEVV
jgi:hypothetical protein